MKNFWKFVVFACLITQFSYPYTTNKNAVSSLQKETKTNFSKESLSSFYFVRPNIHRVTTSDLKNNTRIPVGFSYCTTELQLTPILRRIALKVILFAQDIDRCASVSILLFPFHYFW